MCVCVCVCVWLGACCGSVRSRSGVLQPAANMLSYGGVPYGGVVVCICVLVLVFECVRLTNRTCLVYD